MAQAPRRHSEAGFLYVWLLIIVAVAGISAAALGERWTLNAQREKEAELRFRGQQIKGAIGSYWAATPGGARQFPPSLEDLVDDTRGPHVVHHLRRIYLDPFTGYADWILIPVDAANPTGQFRGVRSRARVPMLGIPASAASSPGQDPTVSDLEFIFTPPGSG